MSGLDDMCRFGCTGNADKVREIFDEAGLDLVSVVKNFLDSELLDDFGDDILGKGS